MEGTHALSAPATPVHHTGSIFEKAPRALAEPGDRGTTGWLLAAMVILDKLATTEQQRDNKYTTTAPTAVIAILDPQA